MIIYNSYLTEISIGGNPSNPEDLSIVIPGKSKIIIKHRQPAEKAKKILLTQHFPLLGLSQHEGFVTQRIQVLENVHLISDITDGIRYEIKHSIIALKYGEDGKNRISRFIDKCNFQVGYLKRQKDNKTYRTKSLIVYDFSIVANQLRRYVSYRGEDTLRIDSNLLQTSRTQYFQSLWNGQKILVAFPIIPSLIP